MWASCPKLIGSVLACLPQVLASDGLWDCMANQEAIQIINDTVKQPAMCAQR